MIEDPDELAKCRETYAEARARLAVIVNTFNKIHLIINKNNK